MLTLSSLVWGYNVISVDIIYIGIPEIIFYIISGSIYILYLYYLLIVFFMRQRRHLTIGTTRISNHYGVATTFTVLLFIWGGLSLLWTPAPFIVTIYYLNFLVKFSFAFFLCALCPIRDALRSVCKGTAYAAAASAPLAVVLYGYTGGRLMENVGGGGSIAMNLCIGIFCIMYLMLDRSMRKLTAIYLMIFILCGLYLLFSKGRIIALFVMMLVYGMFATSTARRRFARIILLAVGIMITIIISSSKIDAYMYKSSTADTLTGRTVLWARTYDQIRNGPSIRGFGLLSFQSIGPNTFSSLGYLSHAHNEFLNLWFNLGLVGVALAAGLYLALIFTSLKAIKSGIGPFAVLTLCVVVFCLVDGLTDASASMCVIPGQWFILFDCLVSTALAGAVRSTARHIVY